MRFLPFRSAEKIDRVRAKRQLRSNRILHTVLRQGPISKFGLSKVLRLTPPSVGEIIDALEQQGFIRQVGRGPSSGGRKPVLFDLVPSSAFVLGIDLGKSRTSIVLANLRTEVVDRAEGSTLKDEPVEGLVERIKPMVHSLLSRVRGGRSRLQGIGLAVPGLIDEVSEGIYSRDTRFRLLRRDLEAELRCPSFLDNDARTQALAELWFGEAQSRPNCLVVNLGHGIGLGIIAGGQMLRGSLGHTGEIGHVRVEFPGSPCFCGNSGCLETVASGWALAKRAREIIEREPESHLAKLAAKAPEGPSARVVVDAARSGESPLARDLLNQAAKHLGHALATAVNLLNPEAVIIGGGLSRAGDVLFDPLSAALREAILPALRDETTICLSRLGENAGPLGACALVFQRIFSGDAAETNFLI
jgi:N-acetylglucosamine repressor